MVGRFLGSSLKREALAHEDLVAPQGLLGRCSCLLGTAFYWSGVCGAFLAVAGFLRDFPLIGWLTGPSPLTAQGEPAPLGFDSSLIGLAVALLMIFLSPGGLRTYWQSGLWAPVPWGRGQESLLGIPPAGGGGGGGAAAAPPAGLMAGPGGHIVDVKPGELRGRPGGPSWLSPGAFDWAAGGPAVGKRSLAWSSFGLAPYPAPLQGASAPTSGLQLLAGSGGGAGGAGGGKFGQQASVLPTEVETLDTYAAFGVELQRCVPALVSLIEREVLEPLIRQLDESDRLWQQALGARGWRLTFEAPRLQSAGVGPAVTELSIFDRYLPQPFCNDPTAVNRWSQRQQLELFLLHPSFEPAQRAYVRERILDWQRRGLANAMRHVYRPSDTMPTDGHILENIVVKMLNRHLEFDNCFLASGHGPPLSKHLGQSPAAYLRQVTDQSTLPKPAPHYEVVTLQKTLKLRSSNGNLLEALALLLHALKRNSRSYQSFPQSLRAAVENSATGLQPSHTSMALS